MTSLSDRDLVRLEVGDTDTGSPLLSDDEYDALLGARSLVLSTGGTIHNIPAAAADAAGAIAAKFGRGFDFAEDGQMFNVSQRVNHYLELEARLRKRAGGSSVPLRLSSTQT